MQPSNLFVNESNNECFEIKTELFINFFNDPIIKKIYLTQMIEK